MITAEFAAYDKDVFATAPRAQETGDITYVDPCKADFTLTGEDQTNPASDEYSGTAVNVPITAYTVVPAFCDVTYSCAGVTGPTGSTVDCNSFTGNLIPGDVTPFNIVPDISGYKDGTLPPGDYTITIDGTVTNADDPTGTKASKTVVITITDPCAPTISLTAGALTDKVYTISDATFADYTHPAWVVDPDYCEVDLTYTISDITDDDSNVVTAVTQKTGDDTTFEFFYDLDLAPVG